MHTSIHEYTYKHIQTHSLIRKLQKQYQKIKRMNSSEAESVENGSSLVPRRPADNDSIKDDQQRKRVKTKIYEQVFEFVDYQAARTIEKSKKNSS